MKINIGNDDNGYFLYDEDGVFITTIIYFGDMEHGKYIELMVKEYNAIEQSYQLQHFNEHTIIRDLAWKSLEDAERARDWLCSFIIVKKLEGNYPCEFM